MIKYITSNYHRTYLFVSLVSVLAPRFSAIDNTSIRFFLLSVFSGIYLFKNFKPKSIVQQRLGIYISIFSLYLLFSTFIADNLNEGLLSYFKYSVLLVVLYCVFSALKKIEKPFNFVAYIFIASLFFEATGSLFDFINQGSSFTGISMNRNISAFSIVIKLPLLIYLNSIEQRRLIKFIEIISIIAVILLQSRAAIFSLFLVYIIILFFSTLNKKKTSISLLFSLLLFGFFIINNSSANVQKNFNPLNFPNDESINLRLGYYSNALDLFNQKPLFGHGLGSWKYESLRYQSLSDTAFAIPYYVHNDFLQILVELGLIGFFSYLALYILLIVYLIKNFKYHKSFLFISICIIVFIIDSLLNFPIHRSQEFVPMLFLISLIILPLEKGKTPYNNKFIFIPVFFVINMIIASIVSFGEHKSLILQDQLLLDYSQNTYSLDIDQIEKINYYIPNLSANTVPIATYLSRYYINNGNYEKAKMLIDYGLKANPHDIMGLELQLKVYLNNNNFLQAFHKAKQLFEKNPNNLVYAKIYFPLAVRLNQESEFNISPLIKLSGEKEIHSLFFQNYLELQNIDNRKLLDLLNYSLDKFPDNEYLKNLKKTIFN